MQKTELSGVYTSNLLNDLEFYLSQILSLYEAKSLGKYLPQIFSFIKRQYLSQIKIQIVKQIGCVDAAYFSTKKKDKLDPFWRFRGVIYCLELEQKSQHELETG